MKCRKALQQLKLVPAYVYYISYISLHIETHPLIMKPEGMDECDTAAQMYQCGQEKAPVLLANAISAIELNKSAVQN
jgi:hypothetical protein